MDEDGTEIVADALAELLYSLWRREQHQQRTAAQAATSADEPASTNEAN